MNVATLEAALPALTVATLTGVSAAGQVSVVDRRSNVRRAGVHVVWSFVEERAVDAGGPADDLGGTGRRLHALRYAVKLYSQDATQTQRRAWAAELRALHMRRRPTGVTGLDHMEVLSCVPADSDPGAGVPGGKGPAALEADVLFVGDV